MEKARPEKEKKIGLTIRVNFTDRGDAPPLQAYAFTSRGAFLDSAKVEQGAAVVKVPASLNGQYVEVILGPVPEKGQTVPSAGSLKRMGAHALPSRLLVEKPVVEINIPGIYFPKWCLCLVRGKLLKRFTLPNGTLGEQPICNARVHICEVDRIPIVIDRIPDPDIFKLRDDLLDKLQINPRFPIPPLPDPWPWQGPIPGPRPGPGPDPAPIAPMRSLRRDAIGPIFAGLKPEAQQSVRALSYSGSAAQIRAHLKDLSSLILTHLCDLYYFWGFFTKDCLTAVEVDHQGRFSTIIAHRCSDQPDLYFWVEQFQNGSWVSVYKPSIGCGTYWDYACGTEVVINIPGAVGCEEPTYDIPPGVTLFVLPYAIGYAPIWGIPAGAPAAPDGWVRADGYLNYSTGSFLGWLYNAPFGGTLNFIQDDSYFIPSSGIKYYRYSYRRVGTSDWFPIPTPLSRGYRMEYSDRLPTYEAYPVGPFTVGAESNLFEFKPQVPPPRPTDPATVVVREWTSGNLSEVAASWDTNGAAPALSATNTSDDAGDFEVKIEVFDPSGVQVLPGASTFRFLVRNLDGTTTRLATAAEEAAGAYILRVHLDNNGVNANLPQPSIGGVAASDNCGFLRYETGDLVRIQYLAAHPNNHAVFGFGITRGSNGMPSASTLSPYVEVASAVAPTTTSPYVKSGGNYERDFTPVDLVGSCVNAAFAASLGVYGKASNGYQRLGYDASRLIAFALAEQEPDT